MNHGKWINDLCLLLIHKASSAPGISIFPLSPEVAYENTILPGEFHGDPADRMIVATVRITNGTLLTFDRQIINYAKKEYIKIQIPLEIP